MQIFLDLQQWRTYRATQLCHQSLGFVPTMGALHQGHLSLIQASQQDNQHTIVSIFVNPTQFNQAEDFSHYPRPIEADIELLTEVGVDFCLIPKSEDIYKDNYQFQITEHQVSQLMEGLYRPGHFNGVLTVVMKLLNLVKPTRAYFGEKDYQQYQLIRQMADAFFMDIEIRGCATIREESLLPLSSRNQRLSPDDLKLAHQIARIFHQNIPLSEISTQLKALGVPLDYLEEHFGRRFIAAHVGPIRLIDNYPVGQRLENA